MLKRDIHRRGRRAVFRGGERSGVAVRENAVPVVQKSKAQLADGAADGDILIADALRLRKKSLADGRNALTGVGRAEARYSFVSRRRAKKTSLSSVSICEAASASA